jgi:DNA-binding transcriptional regulator YdaS (Cro superfamily)
MEMSPEEALHKAIEQVGSMRALAEKLGVTKGAVGQWKLEGRQVPAEHCPDIERLVNRLVTCEQLRPDVDWGFLRGSDVSPQADERRQIERQAKDRRTSTTN